MFGLLNIIRRSRSSNNIEHFWFCPQSVPNFKEEMNALSTIQSWIVWPSTIYGHFLYLFFVSSPKQYYIHSMNYLQFGFICEFWITIIAFIIYYRLHFSLLLFRDELLRLNLSMLSEYIHSNTHLHMDKAFHFNGMKLALKSAKSKAECLMFIISFNENSFQTKISSLKKFI